MNVSTDTIAAVATAPGEAGIAIVRVSGPDAFRIADTVFAHKGPAPSALPGGRFVHGLVRSPSNRDAIDEVILLIYHAPHSYTTEDVVEIQCHGGRIAARRVLSAVIGEGARVAEPGEFTKRAFLNGRIDLLQAEAVADLISAQSDRAAACAVEQLNGRLTSCVTSTYEALLRVAAEMEASLDFPEEDIQLAPSAGFVARIEQVCMSLNELLRTWNHGHLLREGALTVIGGEVNAGKSTLLNRLLGMERAIVAETPGTTRDTIEEKLILDGMPIRLVDTAGLRQSDCLVEQEGMRRAVDLASKADLVLCVIDSSQSQAAAGAYAFLSNFVPEKAIVILNKTDLGQKTLASDFPDHTTVSCSLLKDRDITPITGAILGKLDVEATAPDLVSLSTRHYHLVQNTLNALNETNDVLRSRNDIAIAASLLRSALADLGMITGRTYTTELLDSIFTRFCIGK